MAASLRGPSAARPATHANGVSVQIEYLEQGGPYRPGTCNIGPFEIARRRRFAIFELGLAGVIAVFLVVVGAPPLARIVIFPILAGAIVSLEQARRHFCAAFALAGIRNFGAREDIEHVADPAAKAADRRAALVMFGYSSLVAAAITALFVVLPI
jgi:hypothetical protein